MKEYKITEEAIKNLIIVMDEVPTKYGRALQDYLRQNVQEIKEEVLPKEEETKND